MLFRDTASFGKRREFIAMAELLRRDFDVYPTLVDDQGIDCIVRLDATRYIDIQIKARSKAAKHQYLFAALRFEPRANLFFLFHTELFEGDYWTIPSTELVGLCSRNTTGKYEGRLGLVLPRSTDSKKYPLFEKFRGENGFDLLRRWQPLAIS